MHAPVDMFGVAGDAERAIAILADFDPDRTAHAAPVDDPVRLAAQGNGCSMCEGRRFRQPVQPRRDPAAMLLRKLLGFPQISARRHGQHDFPRRGLNAERVTARLAVPAHADEIDRLVKNDLERLRLGRAAIKKGTK